MKKISLSLLVLMLFTLTIQTNVFAYSYGDPNKEKIAEVYKKMVVKLNESPPNYEEAKELFLTVKEEIDMHMGEDASRFILDPLNSEDKQSTIQNMEKLLALNISRRLIAVEKSFEEFDKSKKILAKGFATYQALSPAVREIDSELDEQIKNQFDITLESLGNPGLFGVGEKPSDIEQFKQNKKVILDSLKELFNIEAFDVGHFTKSQTEQELENEQVRSGDEYTDYSDWRNWIPLLVIVLVIAGTVIYFVKRKTSK
ncbi:hypothetical protein [Virgibacillus sp. DJP39]|uniref:hypothetical protein n=1 Tax=Virgibacillus sp. DJP39 TaxID=3409790 RepID=UPI003BB61534